METDIQKDRHTERQTYRKTDRQTEGMREWDARIAKLSGKKLQCVDYLHYLQKNNETLFSLYQMLLNGILLYHLFITCAFMYVRLMTLLRDLLRNFLLLFSF